VTGAGIAVGSGHALFGVLLALLIFLIAAWGDWPALTHWRRRT
jgi:Na+-translocating ferredoxin:NAD+ oxidoreductase RnfD subunit